MTAMKDVCLSKIVNSKYSLLLVASSCSCSCVSISFIKIVII